ncbi:MAG: metallophosphoesterase [Bacteroidetes bacterium 4484_249]|nr:MAG: metallophosphoesterase [Bacteroidetes bacterium 4484_249]
MKIQYCSDLHLEFPENKEFLKDNPLLPKGDILLLAGDIVPFAVMDNHKDFFDYVSDNFKYTYWVAGNHEYYRSEITDKTGAFNEKIRSNVFLINNTSVIQNNIKFVFSTLWTKIRPEYQWQIEKGLNDFHVIKYKGYRLSTEKYNMLHAESLKFLKQELNSEKTNKTIVVTHHVPTLFNYPEKYKGSVLNDAFAVELFNLIETAGPDYWVFGHHHQNIPDFKIGKTKLTTNQLGYVVYGEHILFKENKVFSI